MENMPQQLNTPELPPHKNWFGRHMVFGYVFVGLIFAGAVGAAYWYQYRGVTPYDPPIIPITKNCEPETERLYYELTGTIEKIGNTFVLNLECENPKSVYVAESVADLNSFLGGLRVNVKYQYVEYLNKDIQCIKAPCDPVAETRVKILEISGDNELCIQVIQRARNPQTGEVKDFPTPCDVPEGWEKISDNDDGEIQSGILGSVTYHSCPGVNNPNDPQSCTTEPADNLELTVLSFDGKFEAKVTTDAQGKFKIYLAPGDYTIRKPSSSAISGTDVLATVSKDQYKNVNIKYDLLRP